MNRLIKKTVNVIKKGIPRWIILGIDLVITALTFAASYFVFFNFDFSLHVLESILVRLPLVLIFALISFVATSSYKGVVRHTGYYDLTNVFKANVLLSSCLFFMSFVFDKNNFIHFSSISRRIVVIHFLLNTVTLVSVRLLYKYIFNLIVQNTQNRKRVLIYGAGDSGVITYQALKNDTRNKVVIVGFLDDNPSKIGTKIDRIGVYNPNLIDEKFIEKRNITEIIVSIQNISSLRLSRIVDHFSKYPVELKIVPALNTWIDGHLSSGQIKKVNIEDLLGRAPIKLNNLSVAKEINGKTVLITGAAGSIGSEISRQILNYKCKRLIMIDQAESSLYELQQELSASGDEKTVFIVGDIRSYECMDSIFDEYKPQIIFHAAAYKHVPLMENNPSEAVKANIKGSKIIADLAVKHDCEKFVMVSTDKAVNPTNVMGATKRVAELYVSHLNKIYPTNFVITRFGNVLGSNGSVIPLFRKQIKSGGPLTVTHPEITRYFMTIPEACQLVIEASTMGDGGEIFVFDMGEPMKIFDLAKRMIQLSGLKYPEDIDIEITGLRPGEKIYEELLTSDEMVSETYHEKIKIAKVVEEDIMFFDDKIEELISLSKEDDFKIVSLIKELVPEYISNNSVYSSLDKKMI